VALEVSVDVESSPAIIRLAGTLDGDTAVSLEAVVAELIRDGYSRFELKTSALCVPDEGGAAALADLKLLVQQAGGYLIWGGETANRRFAGREDEPLKESEHQTGAVVSIPFDREVGLDLQRLEV